MHTRPAVQYAQWYNGNTGLPQFEISPPGEVSISPDGGEEGVNHPTEKVL